MTTTPAGGVRRMTLADVAALAHIHETSWGPEENSVRLGPSFLRAFYTHVASSPHSFAYVYVLGDKVTGYACGFYDYHAFNRSMRKRYLFRLAWLAVSRLLTRKLTLRDLKNLLNDRAKNESSKYPKHHLGAIAVANEFKGTPEGKVGYRAAIGAVLDDFRAHGCAGCWGLTDERNIPMRKVLEKFGFHEVEIIQAIGRRLALYDIGFDDAAAKAP